MAYLDACGSCPRLQYGSNPNVTYGGVPIEMAAVAPQKGDNERNIMGFATGFLFTNSIVLPIIL